MADWITSFSFSTWKCAKRKSTLIKIDLTCGFVVRFLQIIDYFNTHCVIGFGCLKQIGIEIFISLRSFRCNDFGLWLCNALLWLSFNSTSSLFRKLYKISREKRDRVSWHRGWCQSHGFLLKFMCTVRCVLWVHLFASPQNEQLPIN